MHRHCCSVCRHSQGVHHSGRCKAIYSRSCGAENSLQVNPDVDTHGLATPVVLVMVLLRGEVHAAKLVAEYEVTLQVRFVSDNTQSVVDIQNVYTCRSIDDVTRLMPDDHVIVFWYGEFHDGMVR